ncbi:MAG: tetratricopeptide repeat protein [Vicingaceae bacterium]
MGSIIKEMQETTNRLQKAIALHQSGKFAAAEMAYRDILNEVESDPKLYSNLADVLVKQGKGNEALEEVNRAIKAHPTDINLQLAQGQVYMQLGNLNEAKKVFLSLKAEQNNLAEPHYYLGNIYMHEGQQEAAMQAFEETIKHNPDLAEAHYNIGVIRYQKGEKVRARAKWKAALKHRPDLIQALINLGNLELEENQYQEAIHYLDQVLQLNPKDLNAHKLIGMAKHTIGKIDAALEHYQTILSVQPQSEEALTLAANAYRDLNRFKEAEEYYQKVVKINPAQSIAKENLQKLRSGKIESWHYEMLGDLRRNQAYDDVIRRKVKEGETVLDIGTGSGLLSMMAARAGASQVYTCENLGDLADAAADVIAENGYQDKIKIYNLRSSALEVGKHLAEKVDVLVSEILDSGLLGEGVLPTLRHAHNNLIKSNATIIPKAAELKGMLVESDHIHAIAPLTHLSGFNLNSFARFQKDKTYITKQLSSTPHKALSKEQPLFAVDFYNLPPQASPESPNLHEVEFKITKAGDLHAIAFWFELDLDEKLRLSSGPGREMIHWGQAIYAFEETLKVKEGDTINLLVEQYEMGVEFLLLDT